MDKQFTTVEEQVEYGLDSVDPARTVEVPLRDLLFVFQTLGEYVRFFHNADHYPDLAAVNRFLGNRDAGAFKLLVECYYHKLLVECYYHKLRDVLPADIEAGFDGGAFDNPDYPHYYEPPDKGTV